MTEEFCVKDCSGQTLGDVDCWLGEELEPLENWNNTADPFSELYFFHYFGCFVKASLGNII